MKKAIIFYSLTDNTKEAADKIAEKLDADLYRIEMLKSMPAGFSKQMMYGGMLASFGIKPKITGVPDNMSEYDEIIIGTPIWAGKPSPAINSFLKSSEIRKKITAVFTLSGGGDNDKCIEILKKILPNLRNTVALADKKLGIEEENANRLENFINSLGD